MGSKSELIKVSLLVSPEVEDTSMYASHVWIQQLHDKDHALTAQRTGSKKVHTVGCLIYAS